MTPEDCWTCEHSYCDWNMVKCEIGHKTSPEKDCEGYE